MAKKKAAKKKAAPKSAAKKSAAKKGAKTKKTLDGTRMLPPNAFSPNEMVKIVHDNDPQHTNCGGSVLCVDQNNIVQVKIYSEGKELVRSYMPSQLEKLL